ncbi:hypothetical protein MRX96_023012 [Rhipicephalus microplus]
MGKSSSGGVRPGCGYGGGAYLSSCRLVYHADNVIQLKTQQKLCACFSGSLGRQFFAYPMVKYRHPFIS